MAEVLSMRRIKQALFIALAAAMLFASGMMIQSTRADPAATPEDLTGFFLEAVQIDFICVSSYTTRDRHVFSLPLISLFGESGGNGLQVGNIGQSLCTYGERLKIMFSINPYALQSPE